MKSEATVNEAKQILRRLSKYSNKTSYYKTLAKNFNYQDVKGYSSTKNICKWMAVEMYCLENNLSQLKDFATRGAISAAINCLYSKVPVYWLQKELIELLKITNNPTHPVEFLPFAEKGILMIPDKMILSPGKQWVKWIYFQYIEAGSLVPDRKIVNGDFEMNVSMEGRKETDGITWTTILDDGAIYAKTVDPKNILQELEFEYNEYEYQEIERFEYSKEKEFTDCITKIVYQTMLYCYFYKIETNVSDGIVKKGFANNSNKTHKLAPVWIGKEKRRSHRAASGSLSTNNASLINRHYQVEMAYRIGHWRNQKIGIRNGPSSKLIWIKPTVVNYKNLV